MWSAKINASTAKCEAPDEVDPVVTLSGIGLATAGRFLVEGALVVVCGLRRRRLRKPERSSRTSARERVLVLAADAGLTHQDK